MTATKRQYEATAQFHARMANAFDAEGKHAEAIRARVAMTRAIAMVEACKDDEKEN